MRAERGDGGGAAAEEGVEDEVAGVGGGEQAAFDEGDGFLGGVFAVGFFGIGGRGQGPDGKFLEVHRADSADFRRLGLISEGRFRDGVDRPSINPDLRQTVFICLPVTAFMAW